MISNIIQLPLPLYFNQSLLHPLVLSLVVSTSPPFSLPNPMAPKRTARIQVQEPCSCPKCSYPSIGLGNVSEDGLIRQVYEVHEHVFDLQPPLQAPQIFLPNSENVKKKYQIEIHTVITIVPAKDVEAKGKRKYNGASSSKTIDGGRPKRGRPPNNGDLWSVWEGGRWRFFLLLLAFIILDVGQFCKEDPP